MSLSYSYGFIYISPDLSICSAVVFPPLQNFYHVIFSVSIDFPSNSHGAAPFHWGGGDGGIVVYYPSS